MSATKCARCAKAGVIVTDPVTGEEACAACGYVSKDRHFSLSDDYYRHSDQKDFDREKDVRHHGPMTNLLHYDIPVVSTGKLDYDAHGAPITQEARQLQAKKFYVPRTKNATYKVRSGVECIRLLGDKLNLSSTTQQRAAFLFRRFVKNNSNDHAFCVQSKKIAAASVYLACKEQGVLRDLKTIAKTVSLKKGDVYHVAQYIRTATDTKIKDNTLADSTERLLNLYCDKLSLPVSIRSRALELCKLASASLSGKRFNVIAASCIWLAAREQDELKNHQTKYLKQLDLCDIAGVWHHTIRGATAELEQALLNEKSRNRLT